MKTKSFITLALGVLLSSLLLSLAGNVAQAAPAPTYPPLTAADGKPKAAAHLVRLENGVAELALQMLAPGQTIKAVRIDNIGGVPSLWRSDGQDKAEPLSVSLGGQSLSSSAQALNLAAGEAEMLLSLSLKDNGAFAGKDTGFRVTVFFAGGGRAMCQVEKGSQIAPAPSPSLPAPDAVPVSAPKPQTPAEYLVVAEILPIMKAPGGKYETYEKDGTTYLKYSEDIKKVVVYGNKLKLRPEGDWFALLSPEDESVLGYIPGGGVELLPGHEPANGAHYLAARDHPTLSLTPDGRGGESGLPGRDFSLLKGEVVPAVGRLGGKILLSFGTWGGEGGLVDRFAWADEKDFLALASYQPDNTKADRALIPSTRRLGAGKGDKNIEELPQQIIDSLEKRGFMIDDQPLLLKKVLVDDLADFYARTAWYEADFITADIFLHSFHLIFDQVLQKIERKFLAPRLEENLHEMIGFLGLARRHIDDGGYAADGFDAACDMLSVTRALLSENPKPEGLTPQAAAEVEKIMAASGMENSEITGQELDYTLFKPRGHYTISPEFERYFRATSYLGLAELPLFDEMGRPRPRNIAAAAVISLALDAHQETWRKLEDPINFLVGAPNASDPKIYREITRKHLAHDVDGWRRLNEEAVMAELAADIAGHAPGPKIQSGGGSDTPVFRISPQRFTFDAFIMNRLTSPRVGTIDNPRNLPKGTDVMAVFGSPPADKLSKADYDKKNYEANLAALKDEAAGYLAQKDTVYASWLEVFRAGFEDSGSDQFFYRNEGWNWKKLATNLASWAELKRDTILYAEQSMGGRQTSSIREIEWYAGRFAPPQPRGYVEPVPRFFEALLDAASSLQAFIKEYGVEEKDDTFRGDTIYSHRLEMFSKLLESMRDIARR